MTERKPRKGRFSKGTFDHDGDGKPGGSRPVAADERVAAPNDVWLYRDNEARLFAAGETIPDGWHDTPRGER